MLGATWNGARAFTPTSGPGLSLMKEFLGFAYFTELPAVLFDVQRVGPSTGMPTRTQQADLLAAAYASHGDTKHVLLFPRDPRECFELAVRAFDLADRLQTPVIVMSDLDIGMNDWMCKELEWDPAYRPTAARCCRRSSSRRRRRSTATWTSTATASRIARCRARIRAGSYFLRGSGHNQFGGYTEDADEYQEVLDRLTKKWRTAATLLPPPAIRRSRRRTKWGVVAIGSSDAAIDEALDRLAKQGVHVDYCRIRAFPFGKKVRQFLDAARANLRGRAEPRRAAEDAAHDRDGVPREPAHVDPALRRAADRLSLHHDGARASHRSGGCMTSIAKPKIVHKGLTRNELGLTLRDYEGGMSTLCAGCGHDSITAAIVQAFFELAIPPHSVAKLSGIGCSSKTPAYFLSASHGFNSVHGRMPSIATGACAANRDLYLLGVSGDGDSLSIGLGQFMHALRRNLDMLYIIENNGVYGLTKGQFSASADLGAKAKRGEENRQPPIDPVQMALALGGTFVARSFSGDKEQLVPLIKAGISPSRLRAARRPVALRDVQRSRGLDQELRACSRVQSARDPHGLRAAGRRDHGGLPRG